MDMRKIILTLALALATLCANAQFQEGKGYLGASLTGLDTHWNSKHGFNLGVEAKAGFFFTDDWMLLAQAGFEHYGKENKSDRILAGAGIRYYIVQNGLYLGLNCKYLHDDHSYNDVMPGAEIGYAFFINRSVTIEPAVYYDHSFNDADYSTVGFKLGLGIYLFDD